MVLTIILTMNLESTFTSTDMNRSQKYIAQVCDEIKNMLLEKNMKYGDSALNPVRFLSKSSPIEQILVRIDDKLNRVKQGFNNITDDEDVINDLIGYFILLKVAINDADLPEGFQLFDENKPLFDGIVSANSEDTLSFTSKDYEYLTDMLDEMPLDELPYPRV